MFHLSLPEPLHASAVTPSDTIQYCTSIIPSAIAIPGQQNRSTPHAAAVRHSHSCSAADCGRSSTRLHTLPPISVSLSRYMHRQLHPQTPYSTVCQSCHLPSAIPGQQNRSTPHAAAVRRSHSCSAVDCGRSSTRLHTLPLTCKGTRPHCLTGLLRSGG